MNDPISQPKVAAGLMFVTIVFVAALSWSMKPSTEGGGNKRIPKQDEASQPARTRAVTVQALNGLRVLFIANVMLCHYHAPAGGDPPYLLQEYFQHMPMSFFTVLSGFIRTTTNKERGGYDWKASRIYAGRVIARFGPGYWIALVSLAFLDDLKPPLLAWPVGAAFMQSLLPFKMHGAPPPLEYFPLGGNEVSWFTSCIVISSCIFPGCFNISLRMKTHQKSWLAIMCILVLLMLRYMIVELIGIDKNFFVRLPEFLMGMLTAQVCSLMGEEIVQWLGWGWVFDGLMIVYLVVPHFVTDWQSGVVQPIAPLGWCIVVASAWAAATTAAAPRADLQGKPVAGVLGKLLSFQMLTSLAEYSFGAYIYQFVALELARRVLPEEQLLHALAFALSWLMALLSEKLLEKHVRF